MQLGLAFLWKQAAFRALASWQAIQETDHIPSVSLSAGIQGIGTGNPGFSITTEKNLRFDDGGFINGFVGLGYRTNESHVHPLGGFKWSPDGKFSLGFQHDGHDGHPFTTYSIENYVVGVYLIGGDRPALMAGFRY